MQHDDGVMICPAILKTVISRRRIRRKRCAEVAINGVSLSCFLGIVNQFSFLLSDKKNLIVLVVCEELIKGVFHCQLALVCFAITR